MNAMGASTSPTGSLKGRSRLGSWRLNAPNFAYRAQAEHKHRSQVAVPVRCLIGEPWIDFGKFELADILNIGSALLEEPDCATISA